jgi:hypothetical protein
MEFSPENLLEIPAGKYNISRIAYRNSEDVQKDTLTVAINEKKEKKYFIGDFPNRFIVSINTQESGELILNAFVTVGNNIFEMSEYELSRLRKYKINYGN